MCTVTYLPTGENNYILTSNRDESPGRPTSQPIVHERNDGLKLLYPTDGMAGGSWIAVSNTGATACLLNGAFERHVRNPPYRRSRGLVLVDAFDFERFEDFVEQYSFNQIEPFTLLFLTNGVVHELRWDGEQTHYRLPDPAVPHIWASATLYTPEYIAKRATWFEEWLSAYKSYWPNAIIDFHHTGGEGSKYNDIVMNREGIVQTVSVTCAVRTSTGFEIIYEDLLKRKTTKKYFYPNSPVIKDHLRLISNELYLLEHKTFMVITKKNFPYLSQYLAGYLAALSQVGGLNYNILFSEWLSNRKKGPTNLIWTAYIEKIMAKDNDEKAFALTIDKLKQFVESFIV